MHENNKKIPLGADQPRTDKISKPPQPNFQKLVYLCQTTGLSKEPAIAKALSFLSLGLSDDYQLIEFITEAVDRRQCLDLVDPDPFRATNPCSQEDLSGQIKLGVIPPYGAKWGVNPDDLCCHLLIAGRSGGGKTALITLVLMQILELRKLKIC